MNIVENTFARATQPLWTPLLSKTHAIGFNAATLRLPLPFDIQGKPTLVFGNTIL